MYQSSDHDLDVYPLLVAWMPRWMTWRLAGVLGQVAKYVLVTAGECRECQGI